MMTARKPYPSDVSDDEWALVAPYLSLLPDSANQRQHPLREVFNALRYFVRYGVAWRAMPNDLPPWHAVYDQARRSLAAGCFEMLAQDLRAVLCLAVGRTEEQSAAVLDSRTLRSTPESAARAARDGHKRTRGSKVHAAVDTLGRLLALHVKLANENDRAAVDTLASAVQDVTGQSVTLACVDQGCTDERAAEAASTHGLRLEVVKLADAKRGFVLLSRGRVVEHSFAWMERCRRLARDYERLPETLAGLHVVAFAILMLHRTATLPPAITDSNDSYRERGKVAMSIPADRWRSNRLRRVVDASWGSSAG